MCFSFSVATKDKSNAGKGLYGQVGFNYDTHLAQPETVLKRNEADEEEKEEEDESDLPSKHVTFLAEAPKDKEKVRF